MGGCWQEEEETSRLRSIYYWKTEFRLSPYERDFLRRNQIGQIYLRLFDVVRKEGKLQPNSTLILQDSIPPGIRIIPTIFLANDILRDTLGISELPRQITQRIVSCMKRCQLPLPDEVQIDFDWTARNQTRYFALLTALHSELQKAGIGHLSTTIRLHQLQMQTPPVDGGTLMVYNVGNLTRYDETCSILTPERVKPYLRHLPRYRLPLNLALPIYHWDLLFRNQKFECIVRGIELQDTTRFYTTDSIHYQSRSFLPIPFNGVTVHVGGRILPGDEIRHEAVSADTLHQVCTMLLHLRPDLGRNIILYHLDEKQLSKYNENDIQNLFLCH